MAIAAAMNNQEENKHDDHENDVVMPGFRFHPTEEELVEFYLRRKVEGKRFNVDLITFLDLYRYDPWELPALAAIGEKEWYFYVPRDRKYRNGDRPNRVTASGYWKATGADRMIRSENSRSIGLKKTLVFYSGKAPKGIRTSWIMNEYRLPHHEIERLQKAEISLCRVYKRAGVEDPHSLPTRASSSTVSQQPRNHQESTSLAGAAMDAIRATSYGGASPSSSSDIPTSLALSQQQSYAISPLVRMAASSREDDHRAIFGTSSSHAIDDLHKLVSNYSSQQTEASMNQENHDQFNPNSNVLLSHFTALQTQPQPQPQQAVPDIGVVAGSLQAVYADRLWDWNTISEAGKDYGNVFK